MAYSSDQGTPQPEDLTRNDSISNDAANDASRPHATQDNPSLQDSNQPEDLNVDLPVACPLDKPERQLAVCQKRASAIKLPSVESNSPKRGRSSDVNDPSRCTEKREVPVTTKAGNGDARTHSILVNQQKLLLGKRKDNPEGLTRNECLELTRISILIDNLERQYGIFAQSASPTESLLSSGSGLQADPFCISDDDSANPILQSKGNSVGKSEAIRRLEAQLAALKEEQARSNVRPIKAKITKPAICKAVVLAREKERAAAQKKKTLVKPGQKAQKVALSNGAKPLATAKNAKAALTSESQCEANGSKLLGDLMSSDAIRDRNAQGDFGDAPIINETTKAGHLRELVKSAGDGHDQQKQARADRQILLQASKRFGHGQVKPLNYPFWKLNGMRSPLYHYQLLTADWMVSRELSDSKPHGGILGDGMGVGKTVETLAAMVANKADQVDVKANRKATLVVAPASAITQWSNEIKSHVDKGVFKEVILYRDSKPNLPRIQKADIVLCSYNDIWLSQARKLQNSRAGATMTTAKGFEPGHGGELHEVEWYRVVLDEAHVIKNRNSATSQACQALMGKYRWALSGTPILNTPDELFPYFKFLEVDGTTDFKQFHGNLSKLALRARNGYIKKTLGEIMKRRIMQDKLFGRPIVELPQAHGKTTLVKFSAAEMTLYRILEEKFRKGVNVMFSDGTANKNYACILAQLLRLRQCTAHPFLLEETIRNLFGPEDLKQLGAVVAEQNKLPVPMYKQIEVWGCQDSADPTIDKKKDATKFGKDKTFGADFPMDPYLRVLNTSGQPSKDIPFTLSLKCGICRREPKRPCESNCGCIFCHDCYQMRLIAAQQAEDTEEALPFDCPRCNGVGVTSMLRNDDISPDFDDDFDSDSERVVPGTFVPQRRGGSPKIKTGGLEWFNMAKDKKAKLLPSAKLIAMKAEILRSLKKAPKDKIIVFTQYTMMARLVGMICKQEGWQHTYFTGDMSLIERNESVVDFRTCDELRIMIANLQCGGQALNLSCANRVISLDLWWNNAVEQQAFGRVFRIGQKKESYLTRFAVEKTIDVRIQALQDSKKTAIDGVISSSTPSLVELAGLLGRVRTNPDGTTVVEDDYDSDDEEGEDEIFSILAIEPAEGIGRGC